MSTVLVISCLLACLSVAAASVRVGACNAVGWAFLAAVALGTALHAGHRSIALVASTTCLLAAAVILKDEWGLARGRSR